MNDWALAEIERMLANMLRVGVVAQLDEQNARVKVKTAGVTTDWLPWSALRAGEDRTWHPPEPGEQVMVMAPYGDMGQAVVLPGIYQDAHPAPGNRRGVSRTEFKDGAFIQYDRDAHVYEVNIPAGGEVHLRVGSSLLTIKDNEAKLETQKFMVQAPETEFSGDVKIDGKLDVDGNITTQSGDVKAGTVSMRNHRHGGVYPGAFSTLPPNT